MTKTGNSILESALSYAARGWSVLPLFGVLATGCECGDPHCRTPGKHPPIQRGLLRASRDASQITSWFLDRPGRNLAIATGPSGLAVLDVDAKRGGPETLRRLDVDTRKAAKVRTGGGWHLYFQGPVPTSCGSLGPGLDVRGVGGYAVAPPSTHITGVRYEWERWVDELPTWPFPASEPGWAPTSIGDVILEGERNTKLFSLAGTLRARELPAPVIHDMIRIANWRMCKPPLSDAEIDDIVASIMRRPPRGRLASGPQRPPRPANARGTDGLQQPS